MLRVRQKPRRAGISPPSAPPLPPPRSAPRWLRCTAWAMSAIFAWTVLLATPANALKLPVPKPVGIRHLQADEMQRLIGQQAPSNTVPQAGTGSVTLSSVSYTGGSPPPTSGWSIKQGTTTVATSSLSLGWSLTTFVGAAPSSASIQVHAPGTAAVGSYTLTYYVNPGAGYTYAGGATNTLAATFNVVQPATSLRSGSSFSWEGSSSVGGGSSGLPQKVNTVNSNKQTAIPLVGWTQRGGLPVGLALVHNSQSSQNTTLGPKWTHSYDLYGLVDGSGNFTIHWGDDLAYLFSKSGSTFTPPTGIYDSLVLNVDSTYTLTTKSQSVYHFNTALRCDSIADENGNTVVLSYTGNQFNPVTDATGRAISFTYTSNKITTITDPLARTWTISYSGTTGDLLSVKKPLLAGQSVGSNYHIDCAYNTAHDITTLTSGGGRSQTFSYNADDSLATSTDGCANQTTYSYSGGNCTITDPNSHTSVQSYTSGKLTSVTDNLSHSATLTYDTSKNVTNVQDERGKNWAATFDSRGNTLTATDPLSNVTTNTFNSHNRLLTQTDALSHVVVTNTYDAHDNLLTSKNALTYQTTYSYDVTGYGLLTTITDPLSHVTTLGYDGNGACTSVEDPMCQYKERQSTPSSFSTL